MGISKEKFAEGLTAQEFIDRMEVNQERFVDNLNAATFSEEDLMFFKEHPVNLAVLGEDWCTDVVHFLPVVIKLANEVPEVNLRIFERDDNMDLMDNYLKEGKYASIPAIVAIDEDWNELGYFNERPAKATDAMAKASTQFAKDNSHLEGVNRTYEHMPEETRLAVRAASAENRWKHMADWNAFFVEDLKSLVTGGNPQQN